ncbi:MAG TPA: thioredoxin family protein [Thermoanaerobaculia bacterium]|nr:thioredoxin family protein [Thermoanaerobaculia bacterium]
MDRTDSTAASSAPAGPAVPAGSQSRLSPAILWIVAAAVLFRILTSVMDRPAGDGGAGLVRWQTLERAPEVARATGKPLLYDFGAAWCGPCKLLDREWADPGVAAKVNDKFVAARVVDRQREDGHNPPAVEELQRRYEVSVFPALIAAAPDGRLLGKLEGYAGRARLERFLEDPSSNP